MRLIDADNFKEDLLKLWDYSSVDGITATTVLKQVISDIDNTPTVELDEGVIQEVLNKRCMTVITNEYLISLITSNGKRPQGEWKVDGCLIACNKCGRILLKASELYNFCPNCGAKMKGGAE